MNDPAPDRDIANVWSALRRRKVVQRGLVYVAGAWGFLQGLEYVSESFNWPQQARQIALLALVGEQRGTGAGSVRACRHRSTTRREVDCGPPLRRHVLR
jgi:hypothetical protein